jgi:K+-dependent Na+/Ca+ exchanger-like protein
MGDADSAMSLWGVAFGETCDSGFERTGGWALHIFVLLYVFYLLAKLCDGHLTFALEVIVDKLKLSEDVAGATFLAAASSAPEIFVSVVSTFILISAGGVGNIVGSALFNLLVIVGACPLFAGRTLNIWFYPTLRDGVVYAVSLVELYLVLMDGKVHWWEAAILVATYAVYVSIMVFNQTIIDKLGLKNPYADDANADASASPTTIGKEDLEASGGAAVAASGGLEAAGASGKLAITGSGKVSLCSEKHTSAEVMTGVVMSSRNLWNVLVPSEREPVADDKGGVGVEAQAGEDQQEEQEEQETYWEPVMWMVDKILPSSKDWLWTLFTGVCTLIALFTYFAVDSTLRLGCLAEIPPIIMGLIIMAAGTSVPDAIGSFVVAKQGYGDMAVANAVGSNTINILVGLGLPWMLYAAVKGPIDMPTEDLEESIIILIGCLLAYLGILTVNRFRVTRMVGVLMLITYVAAIVFIVARYYTK